MPPLPCPCCRAVNTAPPACRRCKADLSALWAAEERRAWLVASTRRRLRHGDAAEASAALAEAAGLRAGDDLRPLRATARLLAGDFAGAFTEREA